MIFSDKIIVNQSLPQFPECLNIENLYSDLPTASIIIVNSNKDWLPFLRTFHSVIINSSKFLKEILIIDNNSQEGFFLIIIFKKIIIFFLENLKIISNTKIYKKKVQIFHLKKRKSLLHAQLFGAHKALGDVLIFLRSNLKVNKGW